MLSGGAGVPDATTLPDAAWHGYLRNIGSYTGQRAICDGRGTVLADFRTRVEAGRYRNGPAAEDEFVVWRTSVSTADGPDAAEEDWSRDELAMLGALAADGSFSAGAAVLAGERFTVEQCLRDGDLRVRTIHAYDWEGGLCGLVVSRERREEDDVAAGEVRLDGDWDSGIGADGRQRPSRRRRQEPASPPIEPAAWRSPNILLDYLLGAWEGRGVLQDRGSGTTLQVISWLQLRRSDNLEVEQESALSAADGPSGTPVRVRARQDGNVLLFAQAGVQLVLLPGGVSAAAPVRAGGGRPFVVETGFLVRPDCRRRVVRSYDSAGVWVNTVFLTERRVG